MAQVFLPCESEAWEKDKRLFLLLSKLNSVDELRGMIDDHNRGLESADVPVIPQRLRSLRGLAIFLTELATEEEREVFFSVTLPFVCRSASLLEALVPDEGIPYLRQQEGAYMHRPMPRNPALVARACLACTNKRDVRASRSLGADFPKFDVLEDVIFSVASVPRACVQNLVTGSRVLRRCGLAGTSFLHIYARLV